MDTEKESVSVYRFQESDQAREYSFNETVEVGLYEDLCLDLKEMMAYLEG